MGASLTAGKTGLNSSAAASTDVSFGGTYQLSSLTNSPISISSTSTGSLEKSGLSLGTFEANVAQVVTNERAVAAAAAVPSDITTGVLNGDTLQINGVTIGAAIASDDKSSDTSAASSTKAASAIAIAAAINKSTDLTGVKAKAEANVIVGQSFTAGVATAIFLNGVTINAGLDAANSRADAAAIINRYTGQTGVVAEDNGQGLTLTAQDGRNISMGTNSQAAVGALGLTEDNVGVVATAAGAKTTYAKVSLQSDHQFTVASGSEGNDNFAKLGFRAGTFGGADNGLKVDQIDVTTQAGATQALVALDEAIKSVSMNQASLGAFQNRLEAVVSNLTEVNQNMSASRSRIQDTDYASETTNLAKSQIIQQAATAMLAQANQSSQSVLSLLK
jgi:flagellin